jgi:hypothetical protein
MNIDDFDWVVELGKCSPKVVFEQLMLGVKSDVKSRNESLYRIKANYNFTVVSDGSITKVFIITSANIAGEQHSPKAVSFSLQTDKIEAMDEGGNLICSATLTLNDKRECRLKVEEKELEQWQFRKLALESLLFTSPWQRL